MTIKVGDTVQIFQSSIKSRVTLNKDYEVEGICSSGTVLILSDDVCIHYIPVKDCVQVKQPKPSLSLSMPRVTSHDDDKDEVDEPPLTLGKITFTYEKPQCDCGAKHVRNHPHSDWCVTIQGIGNA